MNPPIITLSPICSANFCCTIEKQSANTSDHEHAPEKVRLNGRINLFFHCGALVTFQKFPETIRCVYRCAHIAHRGRFYSIPSKGFKENFLRFSEPTAGTGSRGSADCADSHRFGIRLSSFLRPSTFGLRHSQNIRVLRGLCGEALRARDADLDPRTWVLRVYDHGLGPALPAGRVTVLLV